MDVRINHALFRFAARSLSGKPAQALLKRLHGLLHITRALLKRLLAFIDRSTCLVAKLFNEFGGYSHKINIVMNVRKMKTLPKPMPLSCSSPACQKG